VIKIKKLLVIIVTGFLLFGNPPYASADISTNTTSTTLASAEDLTDYIKSKTGLNKTKTTLNKTKITSVLTENLIDNHTISKIKLNEAKASYNEAKATYYRIKNFVVVLAVVIAVVSGIVVMSEEKK
jgi:hypothetical protein